MASFAGTELSHAYGSLIEDSNYGSFMDNDYSPVSLVPEAPAPSSKKEEKVAPVVTARKELQEVRAPPKPQPPPPVMNQNFYQQMMPLPVYPSPVASSQALKPQVEEKSYLDKLFSKKKELSKAVQITLIILLAISIHFVIDHYMKMYINNQGLSFERELMLRLLYPLGILFLLWNMKVFSK